MGPGKMAFNSQPPSKGGIGSKLKTARKKLMNKKKRRNFSKTMTMEGSRLKNPAWLQNHKVNMDKTANRMFIEGPATATRVIPQRGFLKFSAVTGTGFAHPIRKNPGKKIISAGKIMVPIRLTWALGSIVKRPSILAVGSPNRLAAQAWPNS